jgi:hypothetical protein
MQSSNSAAISAENANVMIVHFIFSRSFVMFVQLKHQLRELQLRLERQADQVRHSFVL